MEAVAADGQLCPADDCREQLTRILNNSEFNAPEREHRFLSYIVEETLSGRSDRIKAYTIGVEVFGRATTFNPQLDPIVRIEAAHLRRALERYYLTDGQADSIVITIPKGGYVPTFSRRTDKVPARFPSPAATAMNLSRAFLVEPGEVLWRCLRPSSQVARALSSPHGFW
jgi:hypothetical protein